MKCFFKVLFNVGSPQILIIVMQNIFMKTIYCAACVLIFILKIILIHQHLEIIFWG